MNWILLILFLAAFLVSPVAGQDDQQAVELELDWKQHFIPSEERMFDFKTVAKGTVPVHQFILRNPLQDLIRIKSITASCTCTAIDFDVEDEEKTVLKTYEEAVIPIRLRGDMFEGPRTSTITVTIDKPVNAEIQLHVRGDIRADLDISPRSFIDFGNVDTGKEQSRPLTVTYTGPNTQWRIVDAKCENEFIRTSFSSSDTSRIGIKTFKMNVILDKTAPDGNLHTHLVLISNDTESRRAIPIPIRATVGTVITVRPQALSFGVLLPGEPSPIKNAVLFGTKPFRIMEIECDNPAIEIPLKIKPEDPPKMLYSVPVQYRNPMEGEGAPRAGIMRTAVRITTDHSSIALTFYATASVRE